MVNINTAHAQWPTKNLSITPARPLLFTLLVRPDDLSGLIEERFFGRCEFQTTYLELFSLHSHFFVPYGYFLRFCICRGGSLPFETINTNQYEVFHHNGSQNVLN